MDESLKDPLLLAFFATLGLGADVRSLARGGRKLVILLVLFVLLMLLQNAIGITMARLLDLHPLVGLLAGSISLTGGHGTAAAYATSFSATRNLQGAMELGMAAATAGLILGSLLSGPVAERLMKRARARARRASGQAATPEAAPENPFFMPITTEQLLFVLLVCLACIGVAHHVHGLMQGTGILLPDFLWALLVGMVVRNLATLFKIDGINDRAAQAVGGVSLSLFLIMALMSMRILDLATLAGPMLLIIVVNALVTAAFAYFITGRVMGNDYDAAVVAGGHVAAGLATTAVGDVGDADADAAPRPGAACVPAHPDRRRVLRRHRQRPGAAGVLRAAGAGVLSVRPLPARTAPARPGPDRAGRLRARPRPGRPGAGRAGATRHACSAAECSKCKSLQRQGSAPLARREGRRVAGDRLLQRGARVHGAVRSFRLEWPQPRADRQRARRHGRRCHRARRGTHRPRVRNCVRTGRWSIAARADAWQPSLLSPVAAKPAGQRRRPREIDGADRATRGHRQHDAGTARRGRRHHCRGTRPGAAEHQAPAQSRASRASSWRPVPRAASTRASSNRCGPAVPPWSVSQANTRGSVANALMIDSGEARYALVQSDVAAAAVTGQAAFATYGPLRHLRAVAALFPEPVHVVIRSDDADSISSVSGLRGKRIAVGSRGSGTRQTAMQVLRAHGLDHGDYVIVDARSPEEALQLLADGQIDAVVEVVSAPWRQLATAAAQVPMTLLPLEADAMTRVSESVPGLVPLAIPDRTYGLAAGSRRHACRDGAAGRERLRAGRVGEAGARFPVHERTRRSIAASVLRGCRANARWPA